MSMNKSDLVNVIAEKSGVTKGKAEDMLKATIDAITEELAAGGSLTLIGFGTFKVQNRAARNGRNPRTNEVINIPAKTVVKFSPGKSLEDRVDEAGKSKGKTAKKK